MWDLLKSWWGSNETPAPQPVPVPSAKEHTLVGDFKAAYFGKTAKGKFDNKDCTFTYKNGVARIKIV